MMLPRMLCAARCVGARSRRSSATVTGCCSGIASSRTTQPRHPGVTEGVAVSQEADKSGGETGTGKPAFHLASSTTSAAYTTQLFPYFIPSVFFWPYVYIWQATGAINV
jgi:hypothetical protein